MGIQYACARRTVQHFQTMGESSAVTFVTHFLQMS